MVSPSNQHTMPLNSSKSGSRAFCFLQISPKFHQEKIQRGKNCCSSTVVIYCIFNYPSLKYLSDVLMKWFAFMFSLCSNVLENQYFLPWNFFRSINHGFRLIIIQEPRAKAGEIWPRGKLNSTFIIYERIMTLTLSDVSAIRAIQHNAPHTTIR